MMSIKFVTFLISSLNTQCWENHHFSAKANQSFFLFFGIAQIGSRNVYKISGRYTFTALITSNSCRFEIYFFLPLEDMNVCWILSDQDSQNWIIENSVHRNIQHRFVVCNSYNLFALPGFFEWKISIGMVKTNGEINIRSWEMCTYF